MYKFGKWLGGTLGWVMGGPIGSLLGFAVGSLFDTANITVLKEDPQLISAKKEPLLNQATLILVYLFSQLQ